MIRNIRVVSKPSREAQVLPSRRQEVELRIARTSLSPSTCSLFCACFKLWFAASTLHRMKHHEALSAKYDQIGMFGHQGVKQVALFTDETETDQMQSCPARDIWLLPHELKFRTRWGGSEDSGSPSVVLSENAI